ncbi:MAG TPA: efflux RND transporter periplasmic adaptor subunit [Bryobacteraceae bacterium]|nr:efflux RND transporter periplasmic adaptor subunit [Bryobacteraceae bacterium]
MNKYVVRTSLFWIAAIALGVTFFLWSGKRKAARHHDVTVQPIAEGPNVTQAAPPAANNSSAAPPLVPIQLSAARMQSIGVETAIVEKGPLTDDIRATGTVAIDERLVSYVQVRFRGYIRKVFANVPLQFVKKGDPLFTIYSPELVAAENEYLVALDSRNRLLSSAVEGVASGASDLAAAAKERLRQWNVPEAVIEQVAATRSPVSEMLVTAPVSGYITERNVLPNLYVEPATRLYTVADLSHIWVDAQLFPEDMGRVKPGDAANITVDAFPGQILYGRIEAILPQVDLTTRTGRVRIELPNARVRLKPGMYVNVDLKVGLGSQITVPASAVLMTGSRSIAFLYRSDGQLLPQDVEAGQQVGDRLIILKGLSPGQHVASSANFLVDSESQLQAAAGAFAPPPSGAGAVPQPVQKIKVDFSTTPSPPRKGENQFQVRLTDQQRKPVSNAQVTVVFYMPPMPAMGMSTMTAKSDLRPSGAGIYMGSGVLGSGGTWQVTITVRRGGTVEASKQISVMASGGL